MTEPLEIIDQTTALAEAVMKKWGAENGVKFLSAVISTLVSENQMQVLITDVNKSSRFAY